MNGKGKKKKKKASTKPESGLLSRLFKKSRSGGKKGRGEGEAASRKTNGKARPLSPRERSIQEIKHMAKVGKSDPERLAMLLSRLLSQEKEKQRRAQENFDTMVWDIVKREEQDEDDDADPERPDS